MQGGPFAGGIAGRCVHVLISGLLCALILSLALAADRGARSSQSELCGTFATGKDGRLLLVPVKLGASSISCLLDTGASRSAFDISWRRALGRFREQRFFLTPAGMKPVDTFDWPKATLRNQTLSSNKPVACLELESLRRATNEDIRGILG